MIALSDEQTMVLEMVRRFAREELAQQAPEYDRRGEYPWPQLRKMGELGLLGMNTPEAWGGTGLDAVTWTLVMEEIAAADPSVAVIFSVTSGLPQYMLLKFGTDEQNKNTFAPSPRTAGSAPSRSPRPRRGPTQRDSRALRSGWTAATVYRA